MVTVMARCGEARLKGQLLVKTVAPIHTECQGIIQAVVAIVCQELRPQLNTPIEVVRSSMDRCLQGKREKISVTSYPIIGRNGKFLCAVAIFWKAKDNEN